MTFAVPLGALWMLLAGVLFAAMGVFAKLGAQWFGAADLVFWRSAIGLLVLALLARLKGWPLATPYWRLHLLRGLSGVVSLGLYFWCIARLPLATAVTLNYTSPLFLALFSALLLRERLRADRLRALCLAFAGVVLLLEPTVREDQWRDALLGLASGVLAAAAYLNVKRLGATGEPGWRVVFWFTAVSAAASGAWAAVSGFTPPTAANAWVLLGVGATATVAQLAMTRAYLTGNTLVVGAFAYSTVVFSTLFGMALWGERLAPVALAGMALIIAGGVLVLRGPSEPR